MLVLFYLLALNFTFFSMLRVYKNSIVVYVKLKIIKKILKNDIFHK